MSNSYFFNKKNKIKNGTIVISKESRTCFGLGFSTLSRGNLCSSSKTSLLYSMKMKIERANRRIMYNVIDRKEDFLFLDVERFLKWWNPLWLTIISTHRQISGFGVVKKILLLCLLFKVFDKLGYVFGVYGFNLAKWNFLDPKIVCVLFQTTLFQK